MVDSQEETSVQEMGTMVQQLQEPEVAGELTGPEANELKLLAKLAEAQQEKVVHEQRMLQVLQIHRQQVAKDIVTKRGLPIEDGYSLSDDTGQIMRTHRVVPMPPPELAVVEQEKES